MLFIFASVLFSDSNFKERAEEQKRMQEYQRNCEYVELEEDMGKHIPWCKLTGSFCDMHCWKQTQIKGEEI